MDPLENEEEEPLTKGSYELEVEFNIDDLPEELRMIFCMGYEFCRVVELAKSGRETDMWVFRANQSRINKYLEDSLREFRFGRRWADRVELHIDSIPIEP